MRKLIIFLFLVSYQFVGAAGFAIVEHSVSGLGNSFAGATVAYNDASSIYYNPALMSFAEKDELNVGLHWISPVAEYTDKGTQFTSGVPISGKNDDGGADAFVPNFHAVKKINENLSLGISVAAPYGLKTEYDDDWVGRYLGLKSELKTILINPSISWRVNEKLSVAFGVSAQYADVELSNSINFAGYTLQGIASGSIPLELLPDGYTEMLYSELGQDTLDGKGTVSGDDWGYSFNIGIAYDFNEKHRFGLHYRHFTRHTLTGDADFVLPDDAVIQMAFGNVLYDQGASGDLTTPETVNVSYLNRSLEKWEFMADVMWTRWSRFDRLAFDYEDPVTPDTDIPEDWENVMRYSVGANYLYSDSLLFRFGLCFDESPVPSDELRSPRIPDSDRYWVSTGFSWEPREGLVLSASYVHIFVDDITIDNDTHSAGIEMIGDIDAEIDILSTSLSYSF